MDLRRPPPGPARADGPPGRTACRPYRWAGSDRTARPRSRPSHAPGRPDHRRRLRRACGTSAARGRSDGA
ncbi:hypothetical protein G6F35_018891 [Rhizopus arrhizus]|nr:hypothetical protein G6F32_017051 [Rhizopus arrhizus]KAG1165242.1 hypothetical protein G6F35_018891 [Rhizopus arrhizus]